MIRTLRRRTRILAAAVLTMASGGLRAGTPAPFRGLERGIRVLLKTQAAGGDEDPFAQELHRVMTNDLMWAGVFELVDPSLAAPGLGPADLLLTSRVLRATHKPVHVSVTVQTPARSGVVYRLSYECPIQMIRNLAHRIVDDFTKRTTGRTGSAGSRLVVSREIGPGIRELFRVDRDGQNPIQLTRHGSLTRSPAVAVDGRLAYLTYLHGFPSIYGQRTPGGDHERLYPPPGISAGAITSLAWSPDGTRIVFAESDAHGHVNLRILGLAAGNVEFLTRGAGIDTDPSWSPDGQRIAFSSDRGGPPQIYVLDLQTRTVAQAIQTPGFCLSPAWSPDGTRLACVVRTQGRPMVCLATLEDGKAVRPEPLQEGQDPAWSPDGQWLACISSGTGASALVLITPQGQSLHTLGEMASVQSPAWMPSR